MIKFFKIILICFICLFCSSCANKENIPTITFSTWGSQSEIKIIKPFIAKFEKDNNVKIKLLHIPQNYFQKLHLLFASKQAPDVVFLNNYYIKMYQKAGLLEDLTKYFSEEIKSEKFFQSAINSLSINSKLYAVPRDISNVVVYYNKNLFDKYKIKYPVESWTYRDLLILSEKFKKNGVYSIGFDEHPIFWEPILWANGGGVFNEQGGLDLNNAKSLKALNYYIELRTKYDYVPSKEVVANKTMAQMFLNEDVAMQVSGRWLVPKYRQEAKFDWDIVSLPNGVNGNVSSSDSSGWAISAQTNNLESAVNFVKYLSSAEVISKITETGLITPARKDVAFSNSFLDEKLLPKNAIYFIKNNDNATINPVPENYNEKIEKLMKLLEPYFLGKEKITPYTKFEL